MKGRGSRDLDPLEETQENPALPPARPRGPGARTFLALGLVIAAFVGVIVWAFATRG